MAVTLDLAGRVAAVTGGARGIGRAIAMTLANAGADIAIIDTDTLDTPYNQYRSSVTQASPPATPLHALTGYEAAKVTVKDIQALGRFAMAVKADTTKWAQVQAAFAEILKATSRIDILVNDAGVIYSPADWSIEDWTEDAWDQTMDVNAKGVFLCCKAVIPHMKDRKYGRIINLSSIAGKSPAASAYGSSKFAVIGFTQALARALVKDGITVNAICPGVIWTQMWVELTRTAADRAGRTPEEQFKTVTAPARPMGRGETPEEIAMCALYFATHPVVNGQAWNIDSGSRMER